jgi:hypothetical protein
MQYRKKTEPMNFLINVAQEVPCASGVRTQVRTSHSVLCKLAFALQHISIRAFAGRWGKGLKPLVASRLIQQGVSTPCPQMRGFAKVLNVSPTPRFLRRQVLFFLVLFVVLLCAAENSASAADTTDYSGKYISGTRWAPFVSFAPETSLVVGAQATHFWRPLLQDESERPSSIALVGLLSLRGQWRIMAQYDTYFDNFRWRLFGNVGFERFPLDFFGIGSSSSGTVGERFTPETWRGEANLAYRLLQTPVGAGLSGGVRYEGRADRIADHVAQGRLETGGFTGANGGFTSGAGVFLVLDTRDNVFSSWSGAYVEARSTLFTPSLGSSFSFAKHNLDARYFVPISLFSMTHILALQGGLTAITGGDAPFYALPSLSSLRGILIGQFANTTAVFAQAEYRVPFLEIFEAVAFVGAGTSAGRLDDLGKARVQPIVGGGVRFFFDPNERIGIRMDIGVPVGSPIGSPTGSMPRFYFTFGEAF